ncbi:carbonate dehydratase [Romboutsia sp.]|uniref:carbonate dehydratase n=1 Tax=Romboutsia sp. TaxID=1965302 RepID=UPI002C67635D|nr:carbonate dehydratase [Romboutsia sp.]HSQ89406.1 carbonate dehydratase [Romboutsia sp.]
MIKSVPNPLGPSNQYTYFIGPNPCTSFVHESISPSIDSSVFIGPFSSIIGDVTINANVFIGCNVTLRADEGTPFYIGSNTNLQDGVIFHGLADKYIRVKNKKYSIYVGNNVSCAHGCVIHGPCFIGDDTFIGFKSIIFNAYVKRNCFIGTGAIVTNGVVVDYGRFVPPGAIIDTQDKANSLDAIPNTVQDFSKEVIDVNTEFSSSYPLFFGDTRYSYGD